MRQAITTKYVGPTDTRGSRIVAKAQAGRMLVNYDDDEFQGATGSDAAHARAAYEFAMRWGWYGEWVAGGLPDGKGNCYTLREFKSNAERRRYQDRKLVTIRS